MCKIFFRVQSQIPSAGERGVATLPPRQVRRPCESQVKAHLRPLLLLDFDKTITDCDAGTIRPPD